VPGCVQNLILYLRWAFTRGCRELYKPMSRLHGARMQRYRGAGRSEPVILSRGRAGHQKTVLALHLGVISAYKYCNTLEITSRIFSCWKSATFGGTWRDFRSYFWMQSCRSRLVLRLERTKRGPVVRAQDFSVFAAVQYCPVCTGFSWIDCTSPAGIVMYMSSWLIQYKRTAVAGWWLIHGGCRSWSDAAPHLSWRRLLHLPGKASFSIGYSDAEHNENDDVVQLPRRQRGRKHCERYSLSTAEPLPTITATLRERLGDRPGAAHPPSLEVQVMETKANAFLFVQSS